jgi:hypothetical protein
MRAGSQGARSLKAHLPLSFPGDLGRRAWGALFFALAGAGLLRRLGRGVGEDVQHRQWPSQELPPDRE